MAFLGLVFLLIALSMAGLALGVLLGRMPLQTGCGATCCTKFIKCDGCPHVQKNAGL
jgi:hypothetical protein